MTEAQLVMHSLSCVNETCAWFGQLFEFQTSTAQTEMQFTCGSCGQILVEQFQGGFQ